MLAVKDMHAYYGKSHILQGVNLHIDDGEIVVMEVSRRHMGKQCSGESCIEGADDEGQ